MNLDQLIALSFDRSYETEGSPNIRKTLRVVCSQCETLCINGTPCHETGCPNAMHECAGCNEIVPRRQKYCEDCR